MVGFFFTLVLDVLVIKLQHIILIYIYQVCNLGKHRAILQGNRN